MDLCDLLFAEASAEWESALSMADKVPAPPGSGTIGDELGGLLLLEEGEL